MSFLEGFYQPWQEMLGGRRCHKASCFVPTVETTGSPQEHCNHCGFKQVSPLEALRINMKDLWHEIIKHQWVHYWFQTPSSTSSCPLRHSAVGLDLSCDQPCLSICLVSGALFSSSLRDFASGGHDHLCLEADSLLGANPQQTHWV